MISLWSHGCKFSAHNFVYFFYIFSWYKHLYFRIKWNVTPLNKYSVFFSVVFVIQHTGSSPISGKHVCVSSILVSPMNRFHFFFFPFLLFGKCFYSLLWKFFRIFLFTAGHSIKKKKKMILRKFDFCFADFLFGKTRQFPEEELGFPHNRA